MIYFFIFYFRFQPLHLPSDDWSTKRFGLVSGMPCYRFRFRAPWFIQIFFICPYWSWSQRVNQPIETLNRRFHFNRIGILRLILRFFLLLTLDLIDLSHLVSLFYIFDNFFLFWLFIFFLDNRFVSTNFRPFYHLGSSLRSQWSETWMFFHYCLRFFVCIKFLRMSQLFSKFNWLK